jgi:hypothetical protein
MNIKRGLIRVWIVISFLWVAVFLVIGVPGAVTNVKTIAASPPSPSSVERESTQFLRELERQGESIGEMQYRAKHKIARWQL